MLVTLKYITLKYNNKIYRLLYEDKCAPGDFKNIILDMYSNKNTCMVCQDNNNKVGKYMRCCDYKQFICVDCISQLYEFKMYNCPSCRKPFINDLLFNIQRRYLFYKYLYLHLQNHIITKTDYGVNIYELNSLEESISLFDEEYEEYEYKNIYYKGTKKQQLRHEKQYKFRNQRNRIKHENNCKFTKIKKHSIVQNKN